MRKQFFPLCCNLFIYVHSQNVSFSFAAAGDFAAGDAFLSTVAAVQSANVDFMLMLGDLSYSEGKEEWWCQQWKDRNVSELLIVAGNHDTGEECCGNLDLYLANCPRSLPIVGVPGIRFYLDYPKGETPLARIVMITPDILGSVQSFDSYRAGGEGYLWVETTLKEARMKNIRWLIVGMHKNYISVLTKSDEIGAALMTLLFVNKVDLVLQAHEHGYERSKQLTCAIVDDYVSSCVGDSDNNLNRGNGTVILVLGTGGTELRGVNFVDSEMGYFRAFDTSTFGFGHFIVSDDKIQYAFQRTSGGFFVDSFVIHNLTLPRTRLPTLEPPTSSSLKTMKPTSHRPTHTRTLHPTALPTTFSPVTLSPSSSSSSSSYQQSELVETFETHPSTKILIYVLVPVLAIVVILTVVAVLCWPRKKKVADQNNMELQHLEESKALQS